MNTPVVSEGAATMAEIDALERSKEERSSCRRSTRNVNRIKTSRLRRINEIFWKGDSIYTKESDEAETIETEPSSKACNDEESHAAEALRKKQRQDLCFGKLVLKKIHDSPHVYVMDSFLNERELQYFETKIGKTPKFSKSIVDKLQGEKSGVEQDQRTSTYTTLLKMEHSMVASIERRAADLLGLSTQQLEPLQLVRYQAGQFFGVHHDMGVLYEDGSVELPPRQPWAKRRLVTIFCYLNNVNEGGCTHFPILDIRVKPQRGRAVLFCNIDQHGMPDPRTVHAGEPVVVQSTKKEEGKGSDAEPKKSDKNNAKTGFLSDTNAKYGLNIWACEE